MLFFKRTYVRAVCAFYTTNAYASSYDAGDIINPQRGEATVSCITPLYYHFALVQLCHTFVTNNSLCRLRRSY